MYSILSHLLLSVQFYCVHSAGLDGRLGQSWGDSSHWCYKQTWLYWPSTQEAWTLRPGVSVQPARQEGENEMSILCTGDTGIYTDKDTIAITCAKCLPNCFYYLPDVFSSVGAFPFHLCVQQIENYMWKSNIQYQFYLIYLRNLYLLGFLSITACHIQGPHTCSFVATSTPSWRHNNLMQK